ncbi:Olfactory receptor 5B2 [Heterocephalus glaber]|uniref:Olfactory receptor 5B2 n=1 Tax=Heterocephalus glaber TaxID=10181 RepID=G5BTL5_HETGA|nr:Olfactory receptor 5B2 [Heterocephalus glaber]
MPGLYGKLFHGMLGHGAWVPGPQPSRVAQLPDIRDALPRGTVCQAEEGSAASTSHLAYAAHVEDLDSTDGEQHRGNKVISYNACAAQMFLFATLICSENYLLASMAYDHYAAVCKPLHYTTTMTTNVCVGLVIGCYVISFVDASVHTGDTFSLSFCSSNLVHHFFCDVPPVMALSCSNKQANELILVYLVSFHSFFAFLVISTSYFFIFVTILRMHPAAGHHKALSTCASHFTTISIFYGTVIFKYLRPTSSHSMDTDKISSVFYTIVIPMLNPMVYSLWNKEVNNAFLKVKDKIKAK